MSLDGNVKNFGADLTGSTDSSSAIQAAMNSNFAVTFPPGLYRVDSEIGIDLCKTVVCGLGGESMVTGWDDGSGEINPVRNEEPARFYTTNTDPNFRMFTLGKEQIWWKGGCFDFQNLTNHNGSAFYSAFNWKKESSNSRVEGWGGGIQYITVLGNVDTLRAGPTGGSNGIEFHFPTVAEYPPTGSTLPAQNAYFTMWFFSMQGYGLDKCWHACYELRRFI